VTFNSYPWAKLLVAIITAIAVGIISDSVGWGIATFFILMVLFVWVAHWIFGGTIKGKVEMTDEIKELLFKLEDIGQRKNELPLNARGWCNGLGLYVQLRTMGLQSRLQAGDSKKYSQIDAWQDNSSRESVFEWRVKKYKPGDWEKLVDPTLDITAWVLKHEGLPEEYVDSFNKAIEVFKEKGFLKLPGTKKTGSRKTSKVKTDEDKAKAGNKAKTRSDNPESKTVEYDQNLLDEIDSLEKRIAKGEEIEKEFMRIHGASEKTIKEVVQKARDEGKPLSSSGSGEDLLRIKDGLIDMVPLYKQFPFRLWTRYIPFQISPETNVYTKDDWLRFDSRSLNDKERAAYIKHWEATRILNYDALNQPPVYKWYPTLELMRFVARMLEKYGFGTVLTTDNEYKDEAAWEALGQ